MIEKIGQANYGLFTLATSFITLFVMDFGLGQAVTRFISKYRAENNKEKINNFLGLIYKLYFSIDIFVLLIIVVLYFFINIIYKNLTPSETETFKVLYIIVGLFTVINFPFINLDGILTGYEKFIELKSMTLLNRIVTICLMVFCLLKGYGVYALVTVNAVVGILIIILKLITINKNTDINVNFKYWNIDLSKEIFSFSVWVTLTGICQRMIVNIIPSLIAIVSAEGSFAVAIFGLAMSIEGFIFHFANAINGLFIPKISRIIINEKNKYQLNSLFNKVARIQYFLVGYIFTFWCSFGKSFIIDIWHRSEFSQSYICTIFILFPCVIYFPIQLLTSVILVENKVKEQGFIYLYSSIISCVLVFLFSKFFNAIGASLGLSIALTIRNIQLIFLGHKKLNIDMKFFVKNTLLRIVPFLIIILFLGVLLEYYNPIQLKIYRFLSNMCIFSICYILILFKFIINTYEKELFLGYISFRKVKK